MTPPSTPANSNTILIIVLAITIPVAVIFLVVFGYVCFVRCRYSTSCLDAVVHVFCCEYEKIRVLKERERGRKEEEERLKREVEEERKWREEEERKKKEEEEMRSREIEERF